MYTDPTGHSYVRREVAPGFYSNVWVDDFKEGYKKAFFTDTFGAIKDNATNFLSDPVEYTKNYFAGNTMKRVEYINNIKSGLDEENYYKTWKGVLGIVESTGPAGSIFLDKVEGIEEAKKAIDEKDINKMNYLLGQAVGELSEIAVTAIITKGVTKGYSSITQKAYKPTFVESFIDDAGKPKVVENTITKTSERYTVNRDVNKKYTLKITEKVDTGVGGNSKYALNKNLQGKFTLKQNGDATIIHSYPDPSNNFGHFSVKVRSGNTSLHTEQVITSMDRKTTTIVEVVDEIPFQEVKINLPNSKKALEYQKNIIGKELGPYSEKTNSCVDHISNVLRNGGIEIPESALGQYKFLKSLGFYKK